ncbi:hypothetical protein K8638_22005 [Myxococcus sp. RHST-1-4]|nr:hypothetical protein [Myxococcus sp. RHSTA-1-4]
MARALPGAVLLLALVTGCASTPPGTGGSGAGDLDPERPPHIDTQAGREEAARVAARVWALASSVRDMDSQLRFTFWSEQGALTLVGFVAENRGGRQGKPATDAAGTQSKVTAALVAAMKHPAREVSLTLRRSESSWQVDSSDFIQSFRPTGARTLPLRQGALSPRQTSDDIAAGIRELLGAVQVPTDGTVGVDLEARVRNGRMVGLELTRSHVIRSGRGHTLRQVSPHVATEVANLLLLYAPCTRERSIHLGLRLSHRGNATAASGGVEETRVDLAATTEDEGVALRLPQ